MKQRNNQKHNMNKELIIEAKDAHTKNLDRKWRAIEYCEALMQEEPYNNKQHRDKKIKELIKLLLEIR